MLGFSHLLKSNFGDSATPVASSLEPCLKSGQDAVTAPLPPPQYFDTPMGDRRVPRERDPKNPNYEMIKDARKGVLSGFLRSGKIFRASDFVGIVNPKTAIITLNDVYDFKTRYLATIDDQPISRPPLSSMVPFKKVADKEADDKKTLRNLFFITLAHDELPSFHFWTKPDDLDPVTVAAPFDWGEHFVRNPPSPATTAKIATLEDVRKERGQRGAEEQQNTQNQKQLGFLDGYNDTKLPSLGEKPIQGRPADEFNSISQPSTAPILTQPPIKGEVLLHFNRGGMYLREFTLKTLCSMARWLSRNEEDEDEEEEARKSPEEDRDIFLDILQPKEDIREEKIGSVSSATNRKFQDNIKPFFDQPDNKFRIRSTRYQSWWRFDSGGVGDMKYDLKLVRPNVGYCYCSANWHVSGDLRSNSLRFEQAIRVLFDWPDSPYPKSNPLCLDIPGHDSFDLDRESYVVVDANIQKIFAKLSAAPVEPDSLPTEIFIRDVVKDLTEGSDFLGTSSPSHGTFNYDEGPGDVPDIDQDSIVASDIPDQPPPDILGSLFTGQVLGHNSIETTEIRGGPDLPSIHPRLLTSSEINELQERLKFAEASHIKTDDLQERLEIAEKKLSEMIGLQERLKTSESRAKLKSSCPFCPQDWAGVTKQQQQDHLKLHQKLIVYQPAPQACPQPDCNAWLGENHRHSTHEAISEHLRSHIEEEHAEDGICVHPHCYANMYALTAEQQAEHESFHEDNKDTEEERDRLQQQFRHLQGAANERDRIQENLVHITEDRDSLQDRIVELERLLKATSDGVEGIQPGPSIEVDEDPRPQIQPEAPKKLRYCNVCLKSVDKLSANAKTMHADKCETSVSESILLTLVEAKAEREKRETSRHVVMPKAQERTKEVEVPITAKKRKQKASAKAVPTESAQDEAEPRNTGQQPEASKAAGRKTAKRKIDTFKPSKEDESDEELESPKKKPKLKAKAGKADRKENAPTRRSNRGKDIYEPPEEEEDEDEDEEGKEADDEPSSSAKGGKRKKKAAAVTKASKKAKTKK